MNTPTAQVAPTKAPRTMFWEWMTAASVALCIAIGSALVVNESTDSVQDVRISRNEKQVDAIVQTLGEEPLKALRKSIDEMRGEFRTDMKDVRARLREIEKRIPR